MRFSAAFTPSQPLRDPAVADLLRRLAGRLTQRTQASPLPARQRELPHDLDQRVREVGEW